MNQRPIELRQYDAKDVYWEISDGTIQSVTWFSLVMFPQSPPGTQSLVIQPLSNTSTKAFARISGASKGSLHKLTAVIWLTDGQSRECSRFVLGVD